MRYTAAHILLLSAGRVSHKDEGTRVLQEGFALFELLLAFHDPELARHMKEHDFPPALYLTPFLVTLFGRFVKEGGREGGREGG